MNMTALTADDRLEIHGRFSLAEEAGDVDGMLALFTEDGSVETPAVLFQGKKQLRKMILGQYTMFKKHHAGHVNFSLTMSVKADRVLSQCSFFMVSFEDNPKIVATGSYNDILRKEKGMWKFTQRKVESKAGPEISDVLQS